MRMDLRLQALTISFPLAPLECFAVMHRQQPLGQPQRVHTVVLLCHHPRIKNAARCTNGRNAKAALWRAKLRRMSPDRRKQNLRRTTATVQKEEQSSSDSKCHLVYPPSPNEDGSRIARQAYLLSRTPSFWHTCRDTALSDRTPV